MNPQAAHALKREAINDYIVGKNVSYLVDEASALHLIDAPCLSDYLKSIVSR